MPDNTIDALALLRPLSLAQRVRVWADARTARWGLETGYNAALYLPIPAAREVRVKGLTYRFRSDGTWEGRDFSSSVGLYGPFPTLFEFLRLRNVDISDRDLARILALRDAPPSSRLLTRAEVEAVAALSAEEVVDA